MTDDAQGAIEPEVTPGAADTPGVAQEPDKTAGEQAGEAKEFAWGDDWRDRMAGGDADAAKRLGRFQNPEALVKSYLEASSKLREGLKPMAIPGADASEEDVAAYREAMNIPAEASGYADSLEGIVIGEEDKELVDQFLTTAHASHAPPSVVQGMLEWYQGIAEAQTAAVSDHDSTTAKEAEDVLREAWGGEYRSNMNAISNYSEKMPNLPDGNPLAEALLTARMGNGSLFKNDPTAMMWLMDQIKAGDPAAGVMPLGKSDAKSIGDEIKEIETVMRTDRKTYNKDTKMQARLRDLYAAQERLSA